MAAAMTYSSLVSDISSYLERTDTATLEKIPTFIMLAEQVISSEIQFLGNLTVVTSQMNASEAIIVKPARWRKTVSMNLTINGQRQPIFLRKYEYLRNYWPNPTLTDTPVYYCDYDYTHWFVAPTPNIAYNYEVLYYERVQPLDVTNQTNWYTQYAPQAMLYGSLLQAMPFLKNDERLPMWQQQYDRIIGTLKTEDVARIGDHQTVVKDS